jgi:hypothetical protein
MMIMVIVTAFAAMFATQAANAPFAHAASEAVFNDQDCCSNISIAIVGGNGVTYTITSGHSSALYTNEVRTVELPANVCATITINYGSPFVRGPGSWMSVQDGQIWHVNPFWARYSNAC